MKNNQNKAKQRGEKGAGGLEAEVFTFMSPHSEESGKITNSGCLTSCIYATVRNLKVPFWH